MLLKILLWVVAVVALVAVGFIFFPGPSAKISFTGEGLPGLASFMSGTLVMAVLTSVVLVLLLGSVTGFTGKRLKMIPTGMQNLAEYVIEIFYNLAVGLAGPVWGRRFFPLAMTLFFFIIISAWLSLLPGIKTVGPVQVVGTFQAVEGKVEYAFSKDKPVAYVFEEVLPGLWIMPPRPVEIKADPANPAKGKVPLRDDVVITPENADQFRTGYLVPLLQNPNTDLNTPLALAFIAVVTIQIWGFWALGVTGYGGKFIAVGRLFKGNIVVGLIDVFIGLIEILGEFSRILSFTFRLFGNMFAGQVLLIVITAIVPFVASIPFLGLEAFVGFVQGLVFAMLTLVFATAAIASHHGDDHDDDHGHAHDAAHGDASPHTAASAATH